MQNTKLFQFPFDIGSRPENADELMRYAAKDEHNIDAILNLTTIRIANELAYIKNTMKQERFLDINYEMFMYSICNHEAFDRLMTARGIVIGNAAYEKILDRYHANCLLMLDCYDDNFE